MTTKNSFFRREQQISSVRVARNSNLSGTYYNGPSNNGVGATFTVAASSLTIDSVVVAEQDRVLLFAQTNAYENGIYRVSSIGSTVVLTRAVDFQEFDQMKPGYYVPVAAGAELHGALFGVVEPQVQVVGTDGIVFANAAASPDSVTLANNGLNIYNPAGTFLNHVLFSSAITADRDFTIVTGDAARTLTFTGNATLNQAVDTTASPAFAGVTLNNTGLHILDTNASHDLVIVPGSDLTADRNLTLTTGDAARTLTLSGDATLNQDVSSTGNPAFASVTLNNSGLHVLDTNASHDLIITPGSDLTADRILTLTTGDAARTLDISAADVTVSTFGASLVDDAAASNARTTLQVIGAATADIGGAGAGPISVAVAGFTANTRVVATIASSTNTVAVAKCIGTATGFDITFSGDPGAACVVNYIGIGA